MSMRLLRRRLDALEHAISAVATQQHSVNLMNRRAMRVSQEQIEDVCRTLRGIMRQLQRNERLLVR